MSQEVISLISMVALFGVMYAVLILPQKKKEKKTRTMIDALIVGDAVVTIGGIIGKVVNIKDNELTIESGVEKSKILVKKWAIKEVNKQIQA